MLKVFGTFLQNAGKQKVHDRSPGYAKSQEGFGLFPADGEMQDKKFVRSDDDNGFNTELDMENMRELTRIRMDGKDMDKEA